MQRSLSCVLSAVDGVVEVWTSRGRERATLSGALLNRIAADRSAMPAPGEWVDVVRWIDGRLTVAGRAGDRRWPRLRLVS